MVLSYFLLCRLRKRNSQRLKKQQLSDPSSSSSSPPSHYTLNSNQYSSNPGTPRPMHMHHKELHAFSSSKSDVRSTAMQATEAATADIAHNSPLVELKVLCKAKTSNKGNSHYSIIIYFYVVRIKAIHSFLSNI